MVKRFTRSIFVHRCPKPNTVLPVSLIQLLEDKSLHPDKFMALHWLTFAPPIKAALRSFYFWEYGCSKIILLSPDCSCLTAHCRITGFINFCDPNVTTCVFFFIYSEVSQIFWSLYNLQGHAFHKNGFQCSVPTQLAHPVH